MSEQVEVPYFVTPLPEPTQTEPEQTTPALEQPAHAEAPVEVSQ